MATKIYKKGNVLVGEDTVTSEKHRINGTFAWYSISEDNTTVSFGELTNQHKTMSAKITDCQDESGSAIGDVSAVDTFFSENTNFKPTSGGSGVLHPWFAQTSDGTDINTTGEQALFGAGVGTLTIPANTLKAGSTFHYKTGGVFHCTGGGSRSEMRLKFKNGTTLLVDSGTQLGEWCDNLPWELEIDFTVRTIGSSGTVYMNANFGYQRDSERRINGFLVQGNATLDTTADFVFNGTWEWEVLNTNNKIQTQQGVLTQLF